MKVLVVDDSVVYRKTISSILKSQDCLEVVGEANHGKIALSMLERFDVDLITLDMEMPELNGLETIEEINKAGYNVKILIFAAQTQRGAKNALLALEKGALDIIPKPSGDFESFDAAMKHVEELLLPKVLELKSTVEMEKAKAKSSTLTSVIAAPDTSPKKYEFPKLDVNTVIPKAIVIASSTGGPNALEEVVKSIKKSPAVPILIAQHMPPVFTLSLANRLSKISGVTCVEAKNGEAVEPGRVYIAPGDYHMEVRDNQSKSDLRIYLHKKAKRNDVRPCANYLFESASAIWKNKLVGIVLTGMGADGMEGAIAVKKAGGCVIIQDEESSTVWGMPRAVHECGAYDTMTGIHQIGALVSKLSSSILDNVASA